MPKKPPTPLKSIRAKCLDCMNQSKHEVKLCDDTNCPLHPFRLGRYPKGSRKKIKMTQKRKAQLRKLIKKARESRKK